MKNIFFPAKVELVTFYLISLQGNGIVSLALAPQTLTILTKSARDEWSSPNVIIQDFIGHIDLYFLVHKFILP